jgi:hypothetical protein
VIAFVVLDVLLTIGAGLALRQLAKLDTRRDA